MTELITAIVPAAGVGSRMQADRPKQYLTLHGQTVLEHTVNKLLTHPAVGQVVIAISPGDPYFPALPLATHPRVVRVDGGSERADSVLSALNHVCQQDKACSTRMSDWVMVHDAARPCVQHDDISRLIDIACSHRVGAILAAPVRDTMKRADKNGDIEHTVERVALWHALTPQMFRARALREALQHGLQLQMSITDEASAFECLGQKPALVAARADNIKITQPEDLALADFYLSRGGV